jgi:hypothetical protein
MGTLKFSQWIRPLAKKATETIKPKISYDIHSGLLDCDAVWTYM